MVLWRPIRPSWTNTQKRCHFLFFFCPFHYRGLECKSRKSRNTWSNRQIWPWSTKWSRAKAKSFAKRMPWSYQTPSSNNTRDKSTHGHHQMVNTEIRLIIFFVGKDGEALYSQQKQDWELTGSDYESLLQNSLTLKKVGEITRPFRYNLNNIPYNYTVKVTNRFKELDLIVCLMNCGWRFMTLYERQWSRPSSRKRNVTR